MDFDLANSEVKKSKAICVITASPSAVAFAEVAIPMLPAKSTRWPQVAAMAPNRQIGGVYFGYKFVHMPRLALILVNFSQNVKVKQ